MPSLGTAIIGSLAVAATLGAAQLAFGRTPATDLIPVPLAATAPDAAGAAVNRVAKSDRTAPAGTSRVPSTRTVTVLPLDMAETSIAIRIPVRIEEARRLPYAIEGGRTPKRVKAIVACEPVVSALTEIARRLQPGRCVT